MNRFIFKDRSGQTPLAPEMKKGLKLRHIQTMGELDEYEEQNIAEGLAWLGRQKQDCTKYGFWLKLHRRLFKNVWSWAGKIRKHELDNPDFCLPYQIWPEIKKLEDDLSFWLLKLTFPKTGIAARFHERIETIHPFTNGNGRFGRILVEYFCAQQMTANPSWGLDSVHFPKERRQKYIAALYNARNNKDYTLLERFMFQPSG